jgi:hypothetical protein
MLGLLALRYGREDRMVMQTRLLNERLLEVMRTRADIQPVIVVQRPAVEQQKQRADEQQQSN